MGRVGKGITINVAARPHLPLIPIVIAVALAAAGLLAFTTAEKAVRNYQLNQDERDLRAELRQLDADAAQLEAVRSYLGSDEYIEDVARRVLGLVRPGETLVVVSGSDVPVTVAPVDARFEAARPWWKDLFVPPPPVASAEDGTGTEGP